MLTTRVMHFHEFLLSLPDSFPFNSKLVYLFMGLHAAFSLCPFKMGYLFCLLMQALACCLSKQTFLQNVLWF